MRPCERKSSTGMGPAWATSPTHNLQAQWALAWLRASSRGQGPSRFSTTTESTPLFQKQRHFLLPQENEAPRKKPSTPSSCVPVFPSVPVTVEEGVPLRAQGPPTTRADVYFLLRSLRNLIPSVLPPLLFVSLFLLLMINTCCLVTYLFKKLIGCNFLQTS